MVKAQTCLYIVSLFFQMMRISCFWGPNRISSVPKLVVGRLFGRSLTNLNAREVKSKATESKVVLPSFSELGLDSKLVEALISMNITTPTPVQTSIIPKLIGGENIVMAANTGSGKTFAYVLPSIQSLKFQEDSGYLRQVQRPRCLILVPTRELAKQVLSAVKSISHFAKVSSCSVLGGEPYAPQKKTLEGYVDIVVASPGRIMQHKLQGNVFFGHVTHVIIDEVDTMLTQGFGDDIKALLQGVALHRNKTETSLRAIDDQTKNNSLKAISKCQIIMASASITNSVRALLDGIKGFDISLDQREGTSKKSNNIIKNEKSINMTIVEIAGLHKSIPNVKHEMVDIKGRDKMIVLDELIQSRSKKNEKTMIFCNTINSSRALSYHLESENHACKDNFVTYHGDLDSKEREKNLDHFRHSDCRYLVCTDIAARGLDIDHVDHVIMFDFPLNPIDYIHRSGRTGRAGKPGRVTSLLAKRDLVLSRAIQAAINKEMPLDSLSSSKKDYQHSGKLSDVVNRKRRTVDKVSLGKNRIPLGKGRRGRSLSKASLFSASGGRRLLKKSQMLSKPSLRKSSPIRKKAKVVRPDNEKEKVRPRDELSARRIRRRGMMMGGTGQYEGKGSRHEQREYSKAASSKPERKSSKQDSKVRGAEKSSRTQATGSKFSRTRVRTRKTAVKSKREGGGGGGGGRREFRK